MRKRHLYIIVATVVAALASACMKDEADKPVISFSPVASKATKAIISGNDYPTGESFVVSAYHEGVDLYFEDLTAGYAITQNGTKLWETSESQYWPLDGSLTFNAFSPASASASGVTIDADGISASDYTIQNTTQMTTDLCYASATVADCSDHPDYVSLVFSHALSQVVFRVKAAAYYANTTISMTSLSLIGIYSEADFSGGAWENQSTEHTYSLSSVPTALTYSGTTPVAADVCSYLYLPQTFGPNAALRVGYSITQRVSDTDYTLTNPPVSIPLSGSISQWEPGKKYIYTINIGMDNVITFTASAVGWQDENANIIVEEN